MAAEEEGVVDEESEVMVVVADIRDNLEDIAHIHIQVPIQKSHLIYTDIYM